MAGLAELTTYKEKLELAIQASREALKAAVDAEQDSSIGYWGSESHVQYLSRYLGGQGYLYHEVIKMLKEDKECQTGQN